MSLIESLTNIAVGLGVSFAGNLLILPLFGLNASLRDLGLISVIFTAISLVRSYTLRRAFECLRYSRRYSR
jgi:hypothetical protein